MDKGIELVKKVKADIARCTEIVRESDNLYMVQNAALMIKENQRWLAEWDNQNKIAMRNNVKR